MNNLYLNQMPFNNYFANICTNLSKTVPKCSKSPMDYLTSPLCKSFCGTTCNHSYQTHFRQCEEGNSPHHSRISMQFINQTTVGGRIHNAPLTELARFPFLLPNHVNSLSLLSMIPIINNYILELMLQSLQLDKGTG